MAAHKVSDGPSKIDPLDTIIHITCDKCGMESRVNNEQKCDMCEVTKHRDLLVRPDFCDPLSVVIKFYCFDCKESSHTNSTLHGTRV